MSPVRALTGFKRFHGFRDLALKPHHEFLESADPALAWTESVTLITEGHVPDEVYAEASREFNETDLINLTVAVTLINTWNRISIAFRNLPGEYQVARAA